MHNLSDCYKGSPLHNEFAEEHETALKVRFDRAMTEDEFTPQDLAAMRRSYSEKKLENLPSDPFVAFSIWLHEANENQLIAEANAMVLSTITSDLQVNSRTVLLKDISNGGFTFFTNYQSRKAQEIDVNPNVSILFPWYEMERQISINGFASKVSEEESDEYFSTRPWGSQIGAWASRQSAPLPTRSELDLRVEGASNKWPDGSIVPRPPHWGGFRITPLNIEFWQGRRSRLHDRLRFERASATLDWELTRYYP